MSTDDIVDIIDNAKEFETPEEDDVPSLDMVTEDAAALAFADMHLGNLRFDHDVGAWFEWNGAYWKKDRTHLAFSWARKLARRYAADLTGKQKLDTSKVRFAGAVETFAQRDQRLAVTQDMWDVDHYLLGTPGGTVDLRTGKLRPADPADMITMVATVAPQRMRTPA